jgi:hypothetical protein
MNIRFIPAGLLAGVCLTLALGFGSCENPANEDGNSGGAAAKTAREAADSFFIAHSAILDKPADMLGLEDEAPVNAALAAYRGLSAEAKALLTAEKAHLDNLKVQIGALKNAAENSLYYRAADLGAWLAEQPDNTADSPYTVRYGGNEVIKTLYDALAEAGKYTALDLSLSGVRGFSSGTEEGRAFIVSLVLPDSLTEIPDGTRDAPIFQGFTSLKTLNTGGVIRVGGYTFYMLNTVNSLTTADLPKAETIGPYAFYGCGNLSAINLPEAVTIGNYAFRNCTSLTTISLPKAVTIGNAAFRGCDSLTSVSLPEAVTINGSAFYECISLLSLTSTSLPKAVSIGSSAFWNCTGLTMVSLPEVKTLATSAFSGCTNLTTVSLPKVETIGTGVFARCPSFTRVTLGLIPPTLSLLSDRTSMFGNAAPDPGKVITIDVPYPDLYISAGTPWSDKVNVSNTAAGYFWDNTAATKDNLTVNLE